MLLLWSGFVITELTVKEQRYQAVVEVDAGVPVVEVAQRFGVSRQAVHRGVARCRDGGLEALADRSTRPKHFPARVDGEIETLVCRLRREHLRHSFVSLLSDSGMPLEQIARLLGHTGSAVTERVYRHQLRPVPEEGAATMDVLFPERPQP